MINSNIITIGDEILSGHIIDTNAKWLSEKLNNLGVTISKRLTTVSYTHLTLPTRS